MKKNLGKFKKGKEHPFFGKKFTEEHKRKIGESRKGKKRKPFSKEWRENMSKSHKGKPHPNLHSGWNVGKPAPWATGANHWNWKGGVTPIHEKIRKSTEYKLWQKSVFVRDNYTCRFCGGHGGNLHADHIKPFSLFPELRFAIDNGRTLCVECHKKTDTFGRKVYRLNCN